MGGSATGAGVKLNSLGGSAAGVTAGPNNPAGAPGFVGSTAGAPKEKVVLGGSVTTTVGGGARENGAAGVGALVGIVGGVPKLNPAKAGAGLSACAVSAGFGGANAKSEGVGPVTDLLSDFALLCSAGTGAGGGGATGAEVVAGMLGVKPKETGATGAGEGSVGADTLTGGTSGLTSGQLWSTTDLTSSGAGAVIGVILNALRTDDSVGVVEAISTFTSPLVAVSLTGLMFIGSDAGRRVSSGVGNLGMTKAGVALISCGALGFDTTSS